MFIVSFSFLMYYPRKFIHDELSIHTEISRDNRITIFFKKKTTKNLNYKENKTKCWALKLNGILSMIGNSNRTKAFSLGGKILN